MRKEEKNYDYKSRYSAVYITNIRIMTMMMIIIII